MPQSTTPVDVDGDGDLDLLVIPQPGEDGVEATPVLLLNPGDGDFSDAYDTRVPLPNLPSDKIVGAVDATTDLDGDGLNDIVLVYDDPTQENLLVLNPGNPEGWDASALVALPAADGGSSEGLTSKDVVVVDLDGDGNFEILTADGGSGAGMTSSTFEVGAATATPNTVPDVTALAPTELATGQLNEHTDLFEDVVLGGPTGATILYGTGGDGDGDLADATMAPVGGATDPLTGLGSPPLEEVESLTVADIDGGAQA